MFLVEFYRLNSLVTNPQNSDSFILLHSTLIQTSCQIGQKSVTHIQHLTATLEDIICHPNRYHNVLILHTPSIACLSALNSTKIIISLTSPSNLPLREKCRFCKRCFWRLSTCQVPRVLR